MTFSIHDWSVSSALGRDVTLRHCLRCGALEVRDLAGVRWVCKGKDGEMHSFLELPTTCERNSRRGTR